VGEIEEVKNELVIRQGLNF